MYEKMQQALDKLIEAIIAIKQAKETTDRKDFQELFNDELLENLILKVEMLNSVCNHDFIWDRFESGLEESMQGFCYCRICGEIKK